MASRRPTRLLWFVIPAIMAGSAALSWWFIREPVNHFAVVEEGVLCRGAQPDERGWRHLRDRHGIRTVIDLRQDDPAEPAGIVERRFCAENGIKYIKLPIGSERLTSEELAVIFGAVSDPANRPVLIHCELGKSRTGVAVAAWRIVAQGWSVEAALAEASRFKNNMEPGYEAFLRRLAAGDVPLPGGKRPAGQPK
jgi:protein tyrosine/serine phosphatase